MSNKTTNTFTNYYIRTKTEPRFYMQDSVGDSWCLGPPILGHDLDYLQVVLRRVQESCPELLEHLEIIEHNLTRTITEETFERVVSLEEIEGCKEGEGQDG